MEIYHLRTFSTMSLALNVSALLLLRCPQYPPPSASISISVFVQTNCFVVSKVSPCPCVELKKSCRP
ncbi:hypothetical protein KC19_VG076400 [Ceratodon purpureus]|uniref:Secreted protein n=1 Tax=Ceratodon purpureus TaxID=3225 RepID=A0A8T0HNM6_CERPU|nr:hypothetical protein KC19_VG076400 [Ceratodon purpureus]